MKKSLFTLCLLLVIGYNAVAQVGTRQFNTAGEYLEYVNAKYNIPQEQIYYVAPNDDIKPPGKVSGLMFVKGNKMAIIEDVAKVMENKCAPMHMMKKMTINDVEKSMFESDGMQHLAFTKMQDGTVAKPGADELYAVFMYSHEFGSIGLAYIKQREELEENLGIRTFIVTIDEDYILEFAE